MKRIRAVIRGRVQGVWYRRSAQEKAEELGLAGWVRNLPDGSVEAAFEGSDEAVAAMVAWCEAGPPGARVTSVETREEETERLPHPFRIYR